MTTPEIPKEIIKAYGMSRKFKEGRRRAVELVRRSWYGLDTLRHATPAAQDIHDVKILLDRIALDLSQKNWGR